jgi:hypothetical protein
MAIMGNNIIESINEVVETVLEFPASYPSGDAGTGEVATAPSDQSPADTTSIYYRAEQFIDRESRRIQAWGWPENTRTAVAHLADSGVKTVTFGSAGDVLKVRAAGPDAHRSLVLRKSGTDTQLFDADLGSFNITAGVDGTVYLDITETVNYQYLPPHLQDVIIARAKWTFQRRMQGNMQLDGSLQQEYLQAEASALRNKPEQDQNFNVAPMVPGSGAPQGGDPSQGGQG